MTLRILNRCYTDYSPELPRNHICAECDEAFYYANGLKKHVLTAHADPDQGVAGLADTEQDLATNSIEDLEMFVALKT